jgi:hypothetical protein
MPARKASIDHDNHLGDLDAARRGSDAQLAPYRDEATPMGADKKKDIEVNVIAVTVVKGGTRITLGGAATRGIKVGDRGYLPIGTMAASFDVDKVEGPHAFATVEETVAVGTSVILNPSSPPKEVARPQKHMETRVVGYEVVGGRTKIQIGRGLRSGARTGMDGYVILGGDRHEAFSVAKAEENVSVAVVDLRPDEVKGRPIVLNP